MARSRQNWKKVRLEEVCEDITVGHVGPMANEYVEEGIPFLRSQNIEPFRINADGIKFISEAFHRRLKKCALGPGDVAVVRTGYPGTAAVIPAWLPVANCADLVVIRPSSAISSVFLVAVLNSAWGRSHIAGQLVGVAQQHFNIGNARRLELPLPPIELQQKVANILSAYDGLIENNTKRIKILEEMARSLYHEWFVTFRFPGHEKTKFVKSPLGMIPTDWRVDRLDSAIVLQRGFDLPVGDRVAGTVPIYAATGIAGTHEIAKANGPGVVTGRSGSLGSVLFVREDYWPLNTALWVKEFKAVGPVFTYFLLSNMDLKGMDGGAAVPTLNRNHAHAVIVAIPPTALVQRFEAIADDFLRQAETLAKANANLRATRDLLLPRLISGEIDVSSLRVD